MNYVVVFFFSWNNIFLGWVAGGGGSMHIFHNEPILENNKKNCYVDWLAPTTLIEL